MLIMTKLLPPDKPENSRTMSVQIWKKKKKKTVQNFFKIAETSLKTNCRCTLWLKKNKCEYKNHSIIDEGEFGNIKKRKKNIFTFH